MLIKLRLKNYRSFKEEVTFSMEAEPSKLKPDNVSEISLPSGAQIRALKSAMIFGSNASGKTNVIRALFALIRYIIIRPSAGDSVKIYEPFLFDTESSSASTEYEIDFIGPKKTRYTYSVSFNKKQIEREELNFYPNGKITNLFLRTSSSATDSNTHIGTLGNILGKKEIKVFGNQLLLSKFGTDEPQEELTDVFLYFKNYDVLNATNVEHRMIMERTVNDVISQDKDLAKKMDSLVRFADTKLQSVKIDKLSTEQLPPGLADSMKKSIEKNPYLIYGIHQMYSNNVALESTYSLPFDEESTGTRALYSLGGKVLLALRNGGVLVVDELDTSLHPYLTRMIMYMFQSTKLNPLNAQLIFTSHDMTLLDRDLVRRDQVWITEKNDVGVSDLFSLQDFEGVREETPFDKWYLAGKFGGLPNLKSVDSMFDEEQTVS